MSAMFSKTRNRMTEEHYEKEIGRLRTALEEADAVVIGAGAGLSTSAGFTYAGERFRAYFSDFAAKYDFSDMYSGGFYPYETLEEYWAYWSRYIYINCYMDAPKLVYEKLLELVRDKDYFVLTTNVDHCFQKAGFDKKRLFYTQGDYGLFQCSEPCCQETYDNEELVCEMVQQQKDMRVPTELVPHCPYCGKPMTMNLRADNTFVQDEGWHQAAERYFNFLRTRDGLKTLYLELGVGYNTPGIIKYPFWQMTLKNHQNTYACLNYGQAECPNEIRSQAIRKKLLELAQVSEDEYTAILMQGSGTFGVESVLTSVIGADEKLLICAKGAYGERMEDIVKHAGIDYTIYHEKYDRVPDAGKVNEILKNDPAITHVSMVHSETTSGILNDIESVAKVVKENGRTMIVDAMSSFGGVDIPVGEWGIDFIISSANKSRSLSLDLYDQWETMNKDGKWRFTSPTHVVLAFYQALKEMEAEGGIPARHQRYVENNRLLIEKMKELGIRPYIDEEHQEPIITTFFYPENASFSFADMYQYIKERGYAIYSGKVTEADTFRIGNIGEIYKEDILKVSELIKEFLEQNR